jgi:hypothetical protein
MIEGSTCAQIRDAYRKKLKELEADLAFIDQEAARRLGWASRSGGNPARARDSFLAYVKKVENKT